jgi:hypothetical protein
MATKHVLAAGFYGSSLLVPPSGGGQPQSEIASSALLEIPTRPRRHFIFIDRTSWLFWFTNRKERLYFSESRRINGAIRDWRKTYRFVARNRRTRCIH